MLGLVLKDKAQLLQHKLGIKRPYPAFAAVFFVLTILMHLQLANGMLVEHGLVLTLFFLAWGILFLGIFFIAAGTSFLKKSVLGFALIPSQA